MKENTSQENLEIIEVPLELRGLSDEEIIEASESRLRNKKNFFNKTFRPSKKERLAKKAEQKKQVLKNISEKFQTNDTKAFQKKSIMANIPMPKLSDFATKSESYRKEQRNFEYRKTEKQPNELLLKDLFNKDIFSEPLPLAKEKQEVVVRSSITETPKPVSGRVLKGAFSIFGQKKQATTIVSAQELEASRASERAAKIKAGLSKKKIPVLDENGNPVVKKRGRPPKNKIPE